MKNLIVIGVIATLAGCAHPHAANQITNLYSWDGVAEYTASALNIAIDAQGYPSAAKDVLDAFAGRKLLRETYAERQSKNPTAPPVQMSKEERSSLLRSHGIGKMASLDSIRWHVHPKAPLSKVACLTSMLTEFEKSEFITRHGAYIVGAPNYGGRRLPYLDAINVDYHILNGEIIREGKPFKTVSSLQAATTAILTDLEQMAETSQMGFVNLYFHFSPETQWQQVETVLASLLPKLGGMRGLWCVFRSVRTPIPFLVGHYRSVATLV